jgi:hypothetical protein
MQNKDPDDLSYIKFTAPSQRDKAIHTLEGILDGMWIDGSLNKAEVTELNEWCSDHSRLMRKAPFNEIIPMVKATEDGRMEPEEFDDIKWVIGNLKNQSRFFDSITTDIQELHGVIHGITADGVIEKSELDGLYDWLLNREHLKGLYPYDEIESLIVGILKDGVISETEHSALLAFFNSFV